MQSPDAEVPRRVRRVLLVEAAANMFALVAKLAVGISTGSTAILGDAIHSLTDLLNNGFALAAARISATPPDSDHPYGHGKFEPLAVFALAMLLTVVAFELALHAVTGDSAPVISSRWGLIVMLAVLAANVTVAAWENRQAKRLGSELLRADAFHTLGDVLTTVVVIAGWQLAARGFPWIDPLFAVGVAGLVFYLAYRLFRRAVPVLVEAAVANPSEVIEAVGAIPDVREVRRVRSRESGSGTAADVVVAVDGELSTERSHEIANTIEDALERALGIHDVTVHIEPTSKKS